MKNLIFAGDSHTGVFYPYSDEVMSIYTRGALTMDSFSRGNSDAYKDLVEFLGSLNLRGATLVMCVSEVDVRVHFWRDMPVYEARGMGFDEFLQMKVDAFIERANQLAAQLRIDNIILWGAPASQLTNENHTEELPATGDNMTRNLLTHLLNMCIMRTITARPSVLRFATPFYGMVSEEFVTNTAWLRDGVHLQFGLRPHCMQLLQPLIAKEAFATFSPNFYQLQNAKVAYQSILRSADDVPPYSFFRTWIQTEKKTSITLKNAFGQFGLVNSFADIPVGTPYHELVLRKVA